MTARPGIGQLLSNCTATGQLLVSMVVTQSRTPLTSGCSGRRCTPPLNRSVMRTLKDIQGMRM